jgi:hypothetical protein
MRLRQHGQSAARRRHGCHQRLGRPRACVALLSRRPQGQHALPHFAPGSFNIQVEVQGAARRSDGEAEASQAAAGAARRRRPQAHSRASARYSVLGVHIVDIDKRSKHTHKIESSKYLLARHPPPRPAGAAHILSIKEVSLSRGTHTPSAQSLRFRAHTPSQLLSASPLSAVSVRCQCHSGHVAGGSYSYRDKRGRRVRRF